jgi:hypothetical protein
MGQMVQQQQVVPTSAQPSVAQTIAPAGSGSLQSVSTALLPQQIAQPAAQQQQQVQAPMQGQQPQQQQQQQQTMPLPLQHQISSNLFDEIDGGFDFAHPPSPPPLPADFPSASATLFNFGQFSHKLPAAAPPSQQMAMMPRGMEQELPPSIDELWTPEATYDHHSDGDLMQLLFGAPEQPPTMATIHLHHFLDDDACSSPGLLAGILGGSMDDLAGAAAAGDAAAGDKGPVASTSTAMVAPSIPPPQQLQHGQQQNPQQQQQPAAFVQMDVKVEQQPGQQQQNDVVVTMPVMQQQQPQQQQMHYQQQQQQPMAYAQQHNQQQMQDYGQQQQQQSYMMPQEYQQQLYTSMPVNGMNGMNGMNGLSGLNCMAPGPHAVVTNGQCGSAALQVHMSVQLSMQQQQELAAAGGAVGSGMVGIKGEDEQALLMVSTPTWPATAG